jgi:hypothetical protein
LSENLFALTLCVIVSRIKEVVTAINRSLDQFIRRGLTNRADALENPPALIEPSLLRCLVCYWAGFP